MAVEHKSCPRTRGWISAVLSQGGGLAALSQRAGIDGRMVPRHHAADWVCSRELVEFGCLYTYSDCLFAPSSSASQALTPLPWGIDRWIQERSDCSATPFPDCRDRSGVLHIKSVTPRVVSLCAGIDRADRLAMEKPFVPSPRCAGIDRVVEGRCSATWLVVPRALRGWRSPQLLRAWGVRFGIARWGGRNG